MFKEIMFRFSYYWMEIEMWWDDLWISDKKREEIKESLRKRREAGGCSMRRQYLENHSEAAKYNWEKEFVANK
tara:strand:- start:535 stop:753 length:219 start_codon:yes stop_codon:yes gene_type:complete